MNPHSCLALPICGWYFGAFPLSCQVLWQSWTPSCLLSPTSSHVTSSCLLAWTASVQVNTECTSYGSLFHRLILVLRREMKLIRDIRPLMDAESSLSNRSGYKPHLGIPVTLHLFLQSVFSTGFRPLIFFSDTPGRFECWTLSMKQCRVSGWFYLIVERIDFLLGTLRAQAYYFDTIKDWEVPKPYLRFSHRIQKGCYAKVWTPADKQRSKHSLGNHVDPMRLSMVSFMNCYCTLH